MTNKKTGSLAMNYSLGKLVLGWVRTSEKEMPT